MTMSERDCFRAIAEDRLDDALTYLDEHGIDAPIERGTALHQAVFSKRARIVAALLERGADPNARYDRDAPPLIAAIDLQLDAIARLLVDAGADVNAQDKRGNTPLAKAIFHYRDEDGLIRLLLARGADPRKPLTKSFTAIDMARNMAPTLLELLNAR